MVRVPACVAVSAALAASCDASAPDTRPAPSVSGAGAVPATAATVTASPRAEWVAEVQPGATTLYYSAGTVPVRSARTIATATIGALVMRAECRDGEVVVTVQTPRGTHEWSPACDDTVHETVIDPDLPAGSPLSAQVGGGDGARFAVELTSR